MPKRYLPFASGYLESLSGQGCADLCSADGNDPYFSGLDSRLLGLGDIGALRSMSSYLETECADIGEFQLIKAVEDQNGKKVEISVGLFEPMNPELAKVSVACN
ncbi:hypothetical protein [Proteus penneri]|uniref:Uncharacterized protein n=1 Tax=Proteus penneri TaxID=102862 RepID=A0ABS0W4P5_9GAMM|nr:hypothetical protein [Proteus penneri]MBJ2118268.1 hypothetical protein [Proteus penneri]